MSGMAELKRSLPGAARFHLSASQLGVSTIEHSRRRLKMAGKQRSGGKSSSRSNAPKYPRGARVGATLREIIADELVRIDDERLSFVSITGIDVDPELNRAIVFFDSLEGEDGDEVILEALGEHRIRLQSSIARQIRAKKTPILDFRPDLVIRSAERIDEILRRRTVDEPRRSEHRG